MLKGGSELSHLISWHMTTFQSNSSVMTGLINSQVYSSSIPLLSSLHLEIECNIIRGGNFFGPSTVQQTPPAFTKTKDVKHWKKYDSAFQHFNGIFHFKTSSALLGIHLAANSQFLSSEFCLRAQGCKKLQ